MSIRKFAKPRTLVDEVAGHLREMILRGAIPPGERLSELHFAREFSLSRSSLREAFRMLATQGLVAISPRRGAWVRPISVDDLRDVFEVRALFETFALARGGERSVAEPVRTMRALLSEARGMLAKGDVEAWYESSLGFHNAIIDAAGSRQLKVFYEMITLSLHRYQLVVIGLPRHPDRSQAEHQRIADAFARGQVERACALLRAHLKRVVDALALALEQGRGPSDHRRHKGPFGRGTQGARI